jgi:predicted SAM-dependent methyltransferase
MLKVQFGARVNILADWECHDIELDITKPLPYSDNTVDNIFSEHVVEHITQTEALRFFEECYRILKPGGVIRTTIPDLSRIIKYADKEYLKTRVAHYTKKFTPAEVFRLTVDNNYHKAVYNEQLLCDFLTIAGFKVFPCASSHVSHFGIAINFRDNHLDLIESCTVEGLKEV